MIHIMMMMMMMMLHPEERGVFVLIFCVVSTGGSDEVNEGNVATFQIPDFD